MIATDPKIIVALDFPAAKQAMAFVDTVDPSLCRLKIGKELFTTAGPDLVRLLVERGFDVFLDLKFHDIPNTVNKAISAACQLGVWMVNVHALGGREMMLAAREGLAASPGPNQPLLIAVSILTSIDQATLADLGITKSLEQTVTDLTELALDSGLDGMVCSAREVAMLRARFGDQPVLVTPGIRPAGADTQDQQRVMTPRQAVDAGSSYLVIGRPITQHPDPAEQLIAINQSLG
ncbi:MAG: orotidine-5'-phosphate decarboxylase [Gammaproteobacteria bacterium]|nr:orotidine-5'-phosphate decarboxylase [Gammaproteobacteria bacterium]